MSISETNHGMRTRIKICGITRERDALAAAQAGADAIGFVFYEQSARHVAPADAARIAAALPPFVATVALFVNETTDQVRRVMQTVRPTLLQFHGDETPEWCGQFGLPWMKAVAVRPGVDLLDLAQRYANARALLLDAEVQGYGGGGKAFDWSLIPPNLQQDTGCRLVLSGGLNARNVGEGIARVRPWAVDVSSGVESSKGVKDAGLIRQFCDAVRSADAGAN
jgi:phosphoribosylanthranilate isomerase